MSRNKEFPFGLEDRMGCITYPIIAIEETFMAVRVVHRVLFPDAKVVDHTILRDYISPDRETSYKDHTIYYVTHAPKHPVLNTHIDNLRRQALEEGATPEAIRLLGLVKPWTPKECKIMGEKLKAKATATKGAAKADKEGLKTAAKNAPVAKSGTAATPKRKGNPEALAKARAARQTGPDTRKVKALVKASELKARPGTFRRGMLEDLLKSKTVQEFRDKNPKYDAACVAWAQKEGFVQYS